MLLASVVVGRSRNPADAASFAAGARAESEAEAWPSAANADAQLPPLSVLERVYFTQREGALRARNRGHYPYQGAWPCIWGEEAVCSGLNPMNPNDWKYVCGLRRIRSPRCVIYSIGSWAEMAFERGIKAARPDCEVHVWDISEFLVSSEEAARLNVTLHPFWLSNASYASEVTVSCFPPRCDRVARRVRVEYTTLEAEMRRLGHTHIDILKMDAEGAEFQTLQQLSRRQLNRIGQLQVEVHESRHGNGVATLMAHLESAGFRIFHQEENYRNLGLFEYGLIRNTWHPTMFAGA